MNSSSTVFSARKLKATSQGVEADARAGARKVSVKRDASLVAEESLVSPQPSDLDLPHPIEEFTKTDRYKVSKLDNFPGALEETSVARGAVESQFAIAIGNDTIFVWNYVDKNSSTPITLSFPYEANSYGLQPFVVLVKNAKAPEDPGLVILDAYTGQVKYYESISNAPALRVLNFKILDYDLKLQNEVITLVEHVEDVGIFVATSSKKVMLLTLKDSFNKPHLNKIEIVSPSSSFGFISSIFGSSSKHFSLAEFNAKNNRIVSIKEVDNTDQDGFRQIVIVDSDGGFQLWQFNNVSLNNVYKVNVKNSLCSFLADIYDNIQFSFKVLDVVALKDIASDVFLILTSFNSEDDPEAKNLVLFTAKITASDVLIYSTYKLTCYTAKPDDLPKLILPRPYNTCFVVIDNSVILAEVVTSLDPQKLVALNYKTKWEDVISFRSDVDIVGYGHADRSDSRNHGLLIMTSNAGLLNIEVFKNPEEDDEIDEAELNLRLQQEPMLFIKSHIEQAIYYGTSRAADNPLVFQVPSSQDWNLKDVENAILRVLQELLSNESQYLPKVYPSVEDFLKKRDATVKMLAEFILKNFKELSVDLKILMLNILNKFQSAWIFYTFIKANDALLQLTKSILSRDNSSEDVIRDFFFNRISEIADLLTKFVAANHDGAKNLELLSQIGNSYLDFERTIRYDELMLDVDYDVVLNNKPFLLENEQFLLEVARTHDVIYDSNKDTLTTEQREQFVSLSQFLFYAFNDVASYCNSQDLTITGDIRAVYDASKRKWIGVLTDADLHEFVLKVSELYKDMSSIAEVLDLERDDEKLAFYLDKFGYGFASHYYQFLIQQKDFVRLFDGKSSQYLKRFFLENPSFDYVHWIYQIKVQDYGSAADVLMNLQDSETLVTNRQLDLSLAKLNLIQNGARADDPVLKEINYQMLLCESQLGIEIAEGIPTQLVDKLKGGQCLTVTELVDALSSTRSDANFYKAYEIVEKLAGRDSEAKLLFSRLLLADDWDFLNDTNKTDEYLSSRIKSTITYKTIYRIVQVGGVKNLELSVVKLKNKKIERLSKDELDAQNDKLQRLDSSLQLDNWVQSIISMAGDDQ